MLAGGQAGRPVRAAVGAAKPAGSRAVPVGRGDAGDQRIRRS